jgi:hypothetical protein
MTALTRCCLRVFLFGICIVAAACGRTNFDLADGPTLGSDGGRDAAVERNTNLAFVTSTSWTGDLGGVDGANAKCQQAANLANTSGLPGFDQTFIALIATVGATNYNALSQLQGSRGWTRPDGEWVADVPGDFVSGERNPVLQDETGKLIAPFTTLWTGLTANGTAGAECDNFRSMDVTMTGEYGGTFRRNHLLHDGANTCNNVHRLLCVGTGRVDAYINKPIPAGGKRMFISTALFRASNLGIAPANSACIAEATAAGLSNADAFIPLLPFVNQTSVSLLNDPQSVFYRVDGTRIGRLGEEVSTYLGMRADGTSSDDQNAWSGGDPLTVNTRDCGGWLSGAGSASIANPFFTFRASFAASTELCSTSHAVLCVEN